MWNADFSANRGDIDDTSLSALLHLRQDCHNHIENAPEHRVHRFLKIGTCQRLLRASTDDSCIIDEYINLSKMSIDLFYGALYFFWLCDIADDREYIACKLQQFETSLFQLIFFTS